MITKYPGKNLVNNNSTITTSINSLQSGSTRPNSIFSFNNSINQFKNSIITMIQNINNKINSINNRINFINKEMNLISFSISYDFKSESLLEFINNDLDFLEKKIELNKVDNGFVLYINEYLKNLDNTISISNSQINSFNPFKDIPISNNPINKYKQSNDIYTLYKPHSIQIEPFFRNGEFPTGESIYIPLDGINQSLIINDFSSNSFETNNSTDSINNFNNIDYKSNLKFSNNNQQLKKITPIKGYNIPIGGYVLPDDMLPKNIKEKNKDSDFIIKLNQEFQNSMNNQNIFDSSSTMDELNESKEFNNLKNSNF